MLKKLFLLVASAMSFSLALHAQMIPCSSDEHYQRLLKNYPQLAEYEQQYAAQMKAHVAARTTGGAVDTTTYDMPLVIHIIHDYGTENIPDTVIYDAVAYWAVVYVEQNEDTADVITPFIPYVGNPKIRLHLATIDPNGKPTKGVVRLQSYLANDATDQAKFNQWDPTKYVNIWFVGTFGSEDAGAAAYAYYPSVAAYIPYYDGVIGLSSYANYDKAIPHEIGHVLNLEHPWGNTNSPDVACGDDGVDDTPPTKGHLPSGCVPSALYDTTCAGSDNVTYRSSTGADSVYHYPDTTNAQNIMDYTYCQKMFTKQQVLRMRAALTGTVAGRNNLITPANLAATGALSPMPDLAPIADFSVNRASASTYLTESRCYFLAFNSPAKFTFTNWSWNDTISSVSWAFSNGASIPVSSATGTFANSFSMPGWVTVTLVATSNAGSDTLVNTQTVYAADTIPVGGYGYTQSFASAAAISNWPMFNYYHNQFQWQYYNGASHGAADNSCIRYRSFDTSSRISGDPKGDHDDFYTPAFSLTDLGSDAFLNFYAAGAVTNPSLLYGVSLSNDSLEVDVTTTGGERWYKLAGYTAADLDNNGSVGTEFTPGSSSTWSSFSVPVPTTYQTANTFFRFRYWPGNTGNDLYLDDFEIGQFPAGVQQLVGNANTFNIYPNPATNGCNLVFNSGNSGTVNYMIKDITGKVIAQWQKSYPANTTEKEAIGRDITPSAGLYFVTVIVDGSPVTQKLVVY